MRLPPPPPRGRAARRLAAAGVCGAAQLRALALPSAWLEWLGATGLFPAALNRRRNMSGSASCYTAYAMYLAVLAA